MAADLRRAAAMLRAPIAFAAGLVVALPAMIQAGFFSPEGMGRAD